MFIFVCLNGLTDLQKIVNLIWLFYKKVVGITHLKVSIRYFNIVDINL